jgi:enamine deaminase RidA (YjgF/YER057c/UK114 family)
VTVASSSGITRLHVGPRLSEAAIHNGVVYLAGQIAEDEDADAYGQTREVLGHIDRLLGEAKSSKALILFAQVYLRTLDDYAAMNRAWDQWVAAGETPPRATVEARLARPGLRVEIVVIAAQYG